ncbi:MAG: YbhB/YbcL family Raf kinase inhibitor-like protein [Actinomycetota bacterium]|nr:YbhB/YbcL family Raf kinase inhibitor-like protein [Actinomycetota bacterium]
MILKSTFSDGDRLPDEYANTGVKSGLGKNISPPLKWEDAPPEAGSFALIMVDYDAVSGPFVHWLVIDIPPDIKEIEAGASLTDKMPPGAWELNTDYGRSGYGGARPPAGTGAHGYKTTVYALNGDHLDIEADTGLKDFETALAGKILAAAHLTGVYSQ